MRQACCAGMAELDVGADRMEAVAAAIAVLEVSTLHSIPHATDCLHAAEAPRAATPLCRRCCALPAGRHDASMPAYCSRMPGACSSACQ